MLQKLLTLLVLWKIVTKIALLNLLAHLRLQDLHVPNFFNFERQKYASRKIVVKSGALFCGFALILFARPHQKHDRYEQPEEKQFSFKKQATSLCL